MRELTVKEYADRERVTERTVRRWIDKDAVPWRKTPGGRIRITATGASMTSADKRGQADR